MIVIFTILITLAWLSPATAGTINFKFELRGDQCVVTNSGDSSAYYPVVFKLGRDRQWQPLQSNKQPAELPSGDALEIHIDEPGMTDNATTVMALDSLHPLLVRFFDQTGVSFGQVSLLRSPPQSRYKMKARYADGRLTLEAPPEGSGIRATWVLAPFEEGILPISGALSFKHKQPPATRIEWLQKHSAVIETGAAMPTAMLLHETADGLTMQAVQMARTKKIEQRAAWLYMKSAFYIVGGLCGLFGILLCTNKSVCKS